MITTLQFARALQLAIAYRIEGMSQIEAATQACHTIGISPDWSMIIHLTLDTGYSLAEDWCERIINQGLDRGIKHEGAFR